MCPSPCSLPRKIEFLKANVAYLAGLLVWALKWPMQKEKKLYQYWEMKFASMIAFRSDHVCTIYSNFNLSSTSPTLPQDLLLNKFSPIISCIFLWLWRALAFCLNNTRASYTPSIQIIHDLMILYRFLANQSSTKGNVTLLFV